MHVTKDLNYEEESAEFEVSCHICSPYQSDITVKIPIELPGYPTDIYHMILLRSDLETIDKAINGSPLLSSIVNNVFWREKCVMDGISLPNIQWRMELKKKEIDLDYRTIYISKPFNMKRIDNVSKEYVFNAMGCEFCFPPLCGVTNPLVTRSLSVSGESAERTISIRVADWGITDEIMDLVRPRITVRELHLPDPEGAVFEMRMQLLRSDEIFKRIRTDRDRTFLVGRSYMPRYVSLWDEQSITMENYPAGMRKIAIETRVHNDNVVPNTSSKFANLEILIEFPENVVMQEQFVDLSATHLLPTKRLPPPAGLRRMMRRS